MRSSRICGSNIVSLSNVDKSTESGSGGHTACDTAKVVEKGKLDNIFSNDEAHDHRNESHQYTVEEVRRLEILNEGSTAGNTCADKESHKSKLSEKLEHTLFGLHTEGTEVTEVSNNERSEEAAACSTERELRRTHIDLDTADKHTYHNSNGKSGKTEIVDIEKLLALSSIC